MRNGTSHFPEGKKAKQSRRREGERGGGKAKKEGRGQKQERVRWAGARGTHRNTSPLPSPPGWLQVLPRLINSLKVQKNRPGHFP